MSDGIEAIRRAKLLNTVALMTVTAIVSASEEENCRLSGTNTV